jgi:tight adherence protein B
VDPLAVGAAFSVLAAILVLSLAFGPGTANSMIRGRLEGVLSGTSVVENPGAIDPLRRSRSVLGVYQFLVSGAWLARMRRDLRLADSNMEPLDLVAISVALAGLFFAIPYLFISGVMGLLGGAGAGVAGFMAPRVWLSRRRKARDEKLAAQLPDALTMIANSLKAGFGLLQSLSTAAEQTEHPLSTELAQTVHETNVGSSVEEAFLNLSERGANYDLDLVVTAILVQRSAGGNLSEILETVTETMRERVRIKGEINTLTAQQRLTGFVISLMPVGVGGMFMLVSPDYMTALFTDPLGRMMLGVAVVMQILGVFIIGRILNIEV